MAKHEIIINYDKCTGCRICEVVCSIHKRGSSNPQKSLIRIIKVEGEAAVTSIPVKCMQCEKAICEAICPTRAISSNPVTGAKSIDKEKCIGCSVCVYACPFGAPMLDLSVGCAAICDLCDGEPLCVRFCPWDAIGYVRSDEVSIGLKRARMDKLRDFLNLS